MSTIYATPQDVDDRWFGRASFMEPLDAVTRDGVQRLLDDAHVVLRRKVPDIDERVSNGSLDFELVNLVLARAVLRVLRNPSGFQSEATGQVQYNYGSAPEGTEPGSVGLTAADLADLGVVCSSSSLVQSVRMAEPSWSTAWHNGFWR